MKNFLCFLLGILILMPIAPAALAVDPQIAEVLVYLYEMYEKEKTMQTNTEDTVTNVVGQWGQMKDEWKALTQSYNMGDNTADKNARLWSANDWKDVLQKASGGNNQRFKDLMQSYSTMYPTLQKGGSPVDSNTLVNNSYNQTGQTYNAALSSSAYTYDDVNIRIGKIEALLSQVDDANKNQNEKAAMDLNSRLVAELGFIQLEMLKLQSIHTQMDATKNQNEFNKDTLDKQFTNYKPN